MTAGRDFFVSKRFDVGEFDQDLRNVFNAYKKLDDKMNIVNAVKSGSTPGFSSRTPDFSQAATIKSYRQQLIQEGINGAHRTEIQK